MNALAIRVEGLSKQYAIGSKQVHDTLRDTIAEAALGPVRALRSLWERNGKQEAGCETIWALKDISFEVKRGEVVGIIGRNGAGKSTLLKILSGITEPTEGWADICGRVGSLLEVGTGFHQELTGRENIYLNGAILGMKRAEIARKFDEIVAFAEVEKFIDTPVKHYSSGMYLRLAFAVAAHLEPEILLVDEVLAVGDSAFQKKCLGKMGEAARGGRTVLFVSHNMAAVQSLCSRAVWLDQGNLRGDGPVKPLVAGYLNSTVSALTEQAWDDISTAPGNEKVRLRRARVRPVDIGSLGELTNRTPFVIEFEFWNLVDGCIVHVCIHLINEEGVLVLSTAPINEPVWHRKPFPSGLFRSTCYIPGDLLNDGIHRLKLLVVENGATVLFTQDDVLVFEIREDAKRQGWFGRWPGAVRPNLDWTTECLKAGKPSR